MTLRRQLLTAGKEVLEREGVGGLRTLGPPPPETQETPAPSPPIALQIRANPSSEGRKRYSDIFQSLDNLEISLGNVKRPHLGMWLSGFRPLAGDLVLREDLEPEKTATVTVVNEEEELDLRLVRTKAVWMLPWSMPRHGAICKELLAWTDKRASYELEFAKSVMMIAEPPQGGHSPAESKCHSSTSTPCFWSMTSAWDPWPWKTLDPAEENYHQNEAVQALRRASSSTLNAEKTCGHVPRGPLRTPLPGVSRIQQAAGAQTRSREEAQAKVEALTQSTRAEALYQACVREANARQQDLETTKQRIVSHVRKLVLQGDEVLRRVTMGLFELRGAQAERGPRAFSALAECCAPFEPASATRSLCGHCSLGPAPASPAFCFQEFTPVVHRDARPTPGSDVDSVGGGHESQSLDSPTSSPDLACPMTTIMILLCAPDPSAGARRLVKASSTGTESSDDFEERDPDLGDGMENGLGSPFRKWTLSTAAQTHRLRRLRGPAKCRECEAFMVSGTECEECLLTCHKRCLETLLILCGHRRLPARMPLFGGIYRVSGSRVRVERLCQAFENGRALVELSGNSPHDITSVLKRFLQELTDPVVPFHFYDAFISLAKTLHADPGDSPGTPSPSPEVIRSLKTLLGRLPDSNYNTLRHLVAHLFRVAARFEENKMSANNLGIVFGPTLLRPPDGPRAPSASPMACLLDSSHQAQLVEFLVVHYEQIFGMDELPLASEPLTKTLAWLLRPSNPVPSTQPHLPKTHSP
ncbi:GEM-interacting protein [Peromyscus leucopus]|uniref:GEM-interacting protein n=1 Tax=Peromyscus leucopus TaxID=10041 RepID=UPI0010A0F22B|nr:GEM-interacting protein [Peromyscus leucopus]